jgi:hypothetical protein
MRAGLIALALAACKQGPERPEIELALGINGRAPLGFRCAGGDGPLMSVSQICSGDRCQFALMIDMVDLGPPDAEAPGCRLLELRGWCNDDPPRSCTAIDSSRVCRDIGFRNEDVATQCDRIVEAIANVEVPLLAIDAPDRLVQVRAVAMKGNCARYGYDAAAIGPAGVVKTADELYQQDLLGCAQSCPVVLDNVRGRLVLELDVAGDQCNAETVYKCAHAKYDPIPPPDKLTCGG